MTPSPTPPAIDTAGLTEARVLRDPFSGQDVEISHRLCDRLRGRYANGPTLPSGEPEFGWREFQVPPIQHEAASAIAALRASLSAAEAERDEARNEAYELKYAAAGGEDVAGSANLVTAEDVRRWQAEGQHRLSQLDFENTALAERVKTLEETARPFIASVFNENGDVTISTGHLATHDWLNLKRAALTQGTDHAV